MPTFESKSAVKGEESESDVKEESKSATQTKDVAENVTVLKAEPLPVKDESTKKELVSKLEEAEIKLEEAKIKLEEAEIELEGGEIELEETEIKLEEAKIKLEEAEIELEGEIELEESEIKLEVTVVKESVKKTVEVIVITGAEELSATEESTDVSTIKEASGAFAKAESAIKIEKAVVVESVSSTQQESGSIIAEEKMIIEEPKVESNLAKHGTTSRDELVIPQEKAITEILKLETTERETTQKEAQLRPCLTMGRDELMYQDTQKISDAMAKLNEPYLYDGHQTKHVNIPAPEFDYVPSHADPKIHKMADCFECSVDVSIFKWSNISLHLVDDKINIACRQEREVSNGYEFHDIHYIFPIPVGANKDGITVCITANRRLVVRMPITTEETVQPSK